MPIYSVETQNSCVSVIVLLIQMNLFLLLSQIEFVESLPKTVSAKIRREELRNKEWGRVGK